MRQPALSSVLRYVRSLVGLPHGDSFSDAALLHRFARQHDEAAFVSGLQRRPTPSRSNEASVDGKSFYAGRGCRVGVDFLDGHCYRFAKHAVVVLHCD